MEHAHTKKKIRERLSGQLKHSYLQDWVYGGIDGTVTTFAVVAGVLGAGLSTSIIIILGIANLLADGFSMAAGNYLSTKSEHDKLESQARDVKALNKVLGDYSAGYIVRACGSYKDLLDLCVLSLGALVAIFVPEGTKVGDFVKIEQPYANLIKSLEAAIRKR